jgi:oligopeptide transport system substrate-binding protein
LRIAFAVYPSTLDPRKSGDFVSGTMICLLYEGLMRCGPDGSVEMGLAEKVDISKDGKTYTFHLRKAKWSDGVPITAMDFEKSWKIQLDPKFPSLCTYLFYPIRNGEAVSKGMKKIDEVGIWAIDEKTLLVELEHPTPYFLSLTAFPSFIPIPSHRIEEVEAQPVSRRIVSGPYEIEWMVPHAEIVLRKNSSFWNSDTISIEEIHISIVPDENTAFQMFERKELDWIGGSLCPIPPDALLQSEQPVEHYPMAASTFCTFNTEGSPFSNAKLRKALSLAIDREEITKKILQTGQTPAQQVVPPVLLDRSTSLYDPERARAYYKEALQELGELPPIRLLLRNGQIDRHIAQALQRMWKQVLGLDVVLEQTDYKSHKYRLHRREYQVALAYWIAQYNDPMNILERFQDGNSPKNYSAWDRPRFKQLINEARSTADEKKRAELFSLAEAMLIEEMPIAPLYHWSNPVLCNPRLQNLYVTPSGGVLFEKGKLILNE